MENSIVSGILPVKDDFKSWKFFFGSILLAVTVYLAINVNPAAQVSVVLKDIAFGIAFAWSVFWIGARVVKFAAILLGLVSIGMLIAISLGSALAK